MPAKPQPPYARLNQPPRSPHGRHRSAPKKNHSDPLDGAGASAGGAKPKHTYTVRTRLPTATWRAINSPVMSIDPGVSPGITVGPVMSLADYAKMIMQPIFEEPSPPPIPYTGIHSGEITGHRAWMVTDTYELTSLAHHFVWEPRKTVEGDINQVVYRDLFNRHPPRFGGVYAYSSFDLLRDDELACIMLKKDRFPDRQQIDRHGMQRCNCFLCNRVGSRYYVTYLGLAYGTVKLWGETVEHEKGYRASFAKLTSIDGFIGVDGFDLEKLREKYLP